MKKIIMLCAAMVAIMMMASCSKEKTSEYNEHAFTEQQQKVLDLFHGSWRNGTGDCFWDFHEQSDTNVVVYEDDYVNGPREKYQYQGIVSYRVMNMNGVDTAQYFTYHYYVSRDASYVNMYFISSGSRADKYDLQVPDATHFKFRSSYSSIWLTYEKVQ